ncbi:MAG: hypothetical protein ACR2OD_12805, partial [Gaiellaceae bacterium]
MRTALYTAALAATATALVTGGLGVDDARAGTGVTPTAIRTAERPASVRVVVPLAGSTLQDSQVFLTSRLRKLALGTARLKIDVPGLGPGLRSDGRRSPIGTAVDVIPRAQAVIIRSTVTPGRFKYVSYRIRQGPQRLAIQLWNSSPARSRSTERFGRRGCLTIGVDSSEPGRLVVSGTVG